MKKIFIFQQREWANRIGLHLAKKFKDNNFSLGCLTFKRSTHYNIVNDKNIKYELIISNDDIYEYPEKFINDEINIEKVCKELEIKSIWELIYSDRDLSNSTDNNLHFNFKKKLSDDFMLKVVYAIYSVCEKVYKEFKPDIILAPNFPALTHLLFFHYFKNKKIKMIGMNDTKVGDYQVISYDYNHTEGMFHQEYNKINDKNLTDDHEVNSMIKNFYEKNFYSYNQFSNKVFLKQLSKDFLRDFLESLKSYFNRLNRINESKLFKSQTKRLIPRLRYYNKKLLNIIYESTIKYDDIDRKDNYAYMPLQFQPEASIDIQSFKFSNQIETARQIAMRLPNKMCLYVKDHPLMFGFRKKSYLLKIKSLPNVRLINFRVPTKKVLENSKILISATGSTFFEAAIIKKPAILLGSLGDITKLPNVSKINNFDEIHDYILKKLDQSYDNYDYDLKLKHYMRAAINAGFDSNYVKIWEKNLNPTTEQIDYIFNKINKCISSITN